MSTPGHSPGHQSLVIDTPSGAVALAGQAIYSKTEYEHIRMTGGPPEDDPPPDPERLRAETPLKIARWNELGRTLCSAFLETAERMLARAA